MSDKILDIIASETSPIDYDDNKQIIWKKYGECFA